MNNRLILLPAKQSRACRIVETPADMESREAFRNITGIIAQLEEQGELDGEDLDDALENHGFRLVEFELGPELP